MNAILTWAEGGVRHLRLNRPQRRNSLTADMLLDLASALSEAGKDPAAGVVAISGAGPVFSAGADLGARDEPGAPPSPATVDAANHLVRTIVELPTTVVAVVHGPAVGVGASIALAADLAILRSDAYLLLAFTKVGLMPDGGATALVAAAAGRATAQRLSLLAEPLNAYDAKAYGLVAAVHEEDVFEQRVAATLAALADGPQLALARTKQAINNATLAGLEEAFALERSGQLALLSSPDFAEGAAAFEQKRAPRFSAARN